VTCGMSVVFSHPVFSINKADRHDITEILLKVVLKIMTIPLTLYLKKGKLLVIFATVL
jgi:hypothetical protein